jgi:hypothetical protein
MAITLLLRIDRMSSDIVISTRSGVDKLSVAIDCCAAYHVLLLGIGDIADPYKDMADLKEDAV